MLPVGELPLKIQPESDELRCILVKLTDSSAKSIEEYLKNKNNIGKKPSIVFQRDRGEIIFPTGSTDPNKASYKKFQFVLSSVKETNKDTSASFQCISYSNSKLKTLGAIEQKLTVQANDDVFLATKEKVNKEVEEEKKNATKEIKPSGALVNRAAANANSGVGNAASHIYRQKQPVSHKPISTPNTSLNNSSTQSSANVSTEIPKVRAPILDRPLRERLVHALAVKSFSKPDLINKMMKDYGLTEKEKEQLDPLLQVVATFNSKINCYEILNEIMLSEVKEEFYLGAEKYMIKSRVAKLKQSGAASASLFQQHQQQQLAATASSQILKKETGVGSAFVPLKSTASSSSLNRSALQNTNLNGSLNDSKASLKRSPPKHSDQFKPIMPSSRQQQHSQQQQQPASSSQQRTNNRQDNNKSNSKMFDSLNLSPYSDLDLSSGNLSFTGGNEKKPNEEESYSSQPSKKFKPSLTDKQKEIEQTEQNECARKYHKISNRKQREQYQNEIDQIYTEYLDLHRYVEGVVVAFRKHQAQLSTIKDDLSKEYEEKRNKVISDYLEKQNDAEYVRKRERYAQMSTRLNFINNLCKQYDSSQ